MDSKKQLSQEVVLEKTLQLYRAYVYATETSQTAEALLKNYLTPDSITEREPVFQPGQPYKNLLKQKKDEKLNAQKAYVSYLQSLSEEPNAKELYLFLIPQMSGNTLKLFDATVAEKSYGPQLLLLMMENQQFSGFSEQAQTMLFHCKKKQATTVLDKYLTLGFELCAEAEVCLFSLKDSLSVIEKYLTNNNGLSFVAQEKLFELPKTQMLHLLNVFISSTNAKNYSERRLCRKVQFMLLTKYKELFQKYAEKMRQFYDTEKEFQRKALYPQVAYVAKKKHWL